MRLNIVAGLLTTLFVAGCAVAQSPKPEDEHAGHHPGDAQSGGVTTQSAPAATAASAPDAFDGVVCGRGRNPTLRLWPTIFSGKIDVFPGDRRSRLISSMTSVAPA